MTPLLSICIPAYERPDFLKRLLDSIAQQVFKDFEVIITDDSVSRDNEELLFNTPYKFSIHYQRNARPLGTPLNWMEGIKHASGHWIKIMHDDDYFTDKYALENFAAQLDEGADILFSGYYSYDERTQTKKNKTISLSAFQSIKRDPYRLFSDNLIGPPSVVLFRKSMQELYDSKLKWLVDLEAYVRMMRRYSCRYITQPLVTMSYNDSQVTNSCFREPSVEIPEALYYYKKHGQATFRSIISYDGWWRLIRNLSIRSEGQLKEYADGQSVPSFLARIVRFQQRISPAVLGVGIFSKILMGISYQFNR
ncbi:MAG: glycosyltransferase family 2 protein [Chitinophagia bacterium]|nr:glycosyltransferase family 2 protein [Chitinophagia bacterium]